MNILKKILLCGLTFAALSFGGEDFVASNVCDTLPFGGSPLVELKLAYVDETMWYGNKNLTQVDSQKVTRRESYEGLQPQRSNFPYEFPYSVKAGCSEKKNVTYYYGEWNSNTKRWSLNDENNDYVTSILDIHGNKTSDYDSTNAFNLLAVRQTSLPDDGGYAAGELFVSKTYEFAFDWWYASIVYKRDSSYVVKDGDKEVTYYVSKYFIGQSMGMDSLKVVNKTRSSLTIPADVEKVSLQVFHGVLMDSRKIKGEEIFSSSSEVQISSSSEMPQVSSSSLQPGASSSSVKPAESSSSKTEISSSSEKPTESSSSVLPTESSSSEKPVTSSSSEKQPSSSSGESVKSSSSGEVALSSSSSEESPATSSSSASGKDPESIVARLTGSTRAFATGQVRRLDGSLVKSSEKLTPGVYYIRGADGLWKKQMVLPR